MHARSLEPLGDDCSAARFHNSRAHKQSSISEIGIAHAVGIVSEVVHFFFERRLLSRVLGPTAAQGTDDRFDPARIQLLSPRSQPWCLLVGTGTEQEFGGLAQVLPGMIEIDDLQGCGEVLIGYIPDPRSAVS